MWMFEKRRQGGEEREQRRRRTVEREKKEEGRPRDMQRREKGQERKSPINKKCKAGRGEEWRLEFRRGEEVILDRAEMLGFGRFQAGQLASGLDSLSRDGPAPARRKRVCGCCRDCTENPACAHRSASIAPGEPDLLVRLCARMRPPHPPSLLLSLSFLLSLYFSVSIALFLHPHQDFSTLCSSWEDSVHGISRIPLQDLNNNEMESDISVKINLIQ